MKISATRDLTICFGRLVLCGDRLGQIQKDELSQRHAHRWAVTGWHLVGKIIKQIGRFVVDLSGYPLDWFNPDDND